MKVVVFAEAKDQKVTKSSLEAISYAGKIAADTAGQVVVGVYGSAEVNALGSYGANQVIVCKNAVADTQAQTNFIADVAKEAGAELVVFSQDFTGKSVAPRLSAKLDAGLVSGVVSYPDLSQGFTVKKSTYSGKAIAICKVNTPVRIVSVMPNAIGINASFGLTAQVSEYTKDLGKSAITVKEFKRKGGEGVSLTEADIVVSAGRGLKGPENWGMIEDFAKELGAATACSRPVADIGWRPHHEHVGQTGVAVRPNLYFAIGISGAIQHLAGVNGSKVMVVVNNDPEAPFFKAAHYGIVGDAFEVVPKMIASYKKFKESHH